MLEVGVRYHDGLVGHIDSVTGSSIAGMGEINENPELIHVTDNSGTGGSESTKAFWLCL